MDTTSGSTDSAPSFPRLSARTQRFTLGEPRSIQVTADGARVLFIRTASGTDRAGMLWSFDVATATETLLADPAQLLGATGEVLSEEERARRERARESGAGIVAFSVDDAASVAVFALSGQVWVCPLGDGPGSGATRLATAGSAIDPRIDPTGHRVAYATGGELRVIDLESGDDRAVAAPDESDEPDGPEIVWGQAEFVAAEEMERSRGYWWAPDGNSLLAERYDNAGVAQWYIADPADPSAEPVMHRYPAAGTADAEVQLHHITLDGTRTRIHWDSGAFPYLTRVSWTPAGAPVVQVMSRDQRRARVLAVDPATGDGAVLDEKHDDAWVDLIVGVPALAPDGRLVDTADGEDTRRITVAGRPLTPVGLQVREVLAIDETGVLATASTDPVVQHVIHVGYDGTVTSLTAEDGVHTASAAGGTVAITSATLAREGSRVTIARNGAAIGELARCAESPGFAPRVTVLRTGPLDLATAVLFPRDHQPGSARLPVLMAPYGGPHAQLVRASSRLFLQPQWLADQGFAVVVADGRGTPARGPAWERAIRHEFASVTLSDQVAALAGVAERYPDDMDTGRVGILGWSYGGYLSALAVLDRPDVFHAAVAGAPVTDWRLYDTFYTERYLGHPDVEPEVYERNSLQSRADRLSRPLMIVHGMVDDNVVVAHTLRLSAALLAAGRPHTVLPLTGVTHMTPQEVVAENLLRLQVDFLARALGR